MKILNDKREVLYSSIYSDISETLKDAISEKVNLSRMSLAGFTITSSFNGICLSGATFFSCTFKDMFFSDCLMNRVYFNDCTFINCLFTGNICNNSSWNIIHFISSRFYNNLLPNSSFLNAIKFEKSIFKNNILTDSAFLEPIEGVNIPTDLPEGDIIGWKKFSFRPENVKDNSVTNILVKLLIPVKAGRTKSFSSSGKCRCEYAKVLGFFDYYGDQLNISTVINHQACFLEHELYTNYTINEMVIPDSYDNSRFKVCSHGIHFFIDKELAKEYNAFPIEPLIFSSDNTKWYKPKAISEKSVNWVYKNLSIKI